jgi:hypothetical protein
MCAITGSTEGEEPRAAPGRPGDGVERKCARKPDYFRQMVIGMTGGLP